MVFETWLKSDLKKPMRVQPLTGNLFSADNNGNLIGVEVLDNGQPAQLTGAVTGYVIRADGATVTVIGTLSGNKASIILPASAYIVVGQISIVIKVGTTTVGACTGYVYRSSTDVIIDPGHVVPSLQELLAQIQNCIDATASANTAAGTANTAAQTANTAAQNVGSIVARPYSSSSTYVAGDYCTNNGNLYKANQDISTAEEWTASHWSQIVMGDEVTGLKSAFDDFKNGIDTLNGSWMIGVLDKTTVYPNLKYMVCNPTIQQYDRNIVFSIASGYYLNVNYFDAQGTRTAAYSNRTGTFTVPSGTRFNVSVTENPLDTSLVITDMTRFVNAITFNTIVENHIEALEIATAEDSALVVDLNDGDTFITDGWQVGALDKTTVYPNVDKFTLSNPVIRSFDYDAVVHVKSGFKYTVNIFNENGERTSVVSNNTTDRVFAKGQRFNLYVNRNPVDSTEVITDKTAIEFKSAVYFRCLIGQELDELKKSVDPIAEPNDYYFANNYIQNKCTDIDNLAKSCAANGDVFIFITDEHWTLNEKQSPSLIRYISKQCNIPMVIDGGDDDDYGSNDFCTALNDSFSHKIHHVVGNHDWFPPTNGNMLYYWMDMFNNDQIGNAVEHYYYVDNQQKRIRYIVINAWVNNNGTLESGYSNEQLSWFTNTALNVPAGWDILVFTHFIGDSVTATPEGAQGFRNAIDAYNADPSHAGKVIAIISGHAHFDTVCHTAGGVPIIVTTCDKNKGNGEGNEPWLSQYRPNGTIYEQAFDVMFLDRENKKITALRIGCPAMDNVDLWHTDTGFDFAPTLEQRVITYN